MTPTLTIVHTAVAVLLVVALILIVYLHPLIALIMGALYLGVTAGPGPVATIDVIAGGFGEVMAEIGLLIAFGIFMGCLMSATGALQQLVERLTRLLGRLGTPYAFGLSSAVVFPAVFSDALLVILAPLVRSAAPRLGRHGLGELSAVTSTGIVAGTILIVPGTGALALAGLLRVPLGQMLLYGLIVVIPTMALTVLVVNFLFARGIWNEAADVDVEPASADEPSSPAVAEGKEESATAPERRLPLLVWLLPIILTLVLIAAGAIARTAGINLPVTEFLGNPLIALFIGLLTAYAIGRYTLTSDVLKGATSRAFSRMGEILILAGVGGSFAAVIGKTGLGDLLGSLFTTGVISPIILAWTVAAVLHVAIGSASVSAIASAGILAPIVGGLDVSAVWIALAAGSGAIFCGFLNNSFFWFVKSLLGLSTRGTIKTYTLGESVASIIALLFTLLGSVVLP